MSRFVQVPRRDVKPGQRYSISVCRPQRLDRVALKAPRAGSGPRMLCLHLDAAGEPIYVRTLGWGYPETHPVWVERGERRKAERRSGDRRRRGHGRRVVDADRRQP